MLISHGKRAGTAGARRKRKFNITRVKQGIVFLVGGATAFVSAVTGLGAQPAFAPMLTWMLGFAPEKAQATGLVFAGVTAAAAVVGAALGHAIPDAFLARGCLLFVGAVIGALLAARVVPRPPSIAWRRGSLSLGIFLCLFVLARIGRLSIFATAELASWRTGQELWMLGVVVGGATQALGLPSGLLMVPSLYLFGAFTPSESIALSLLVVALASALPAISYLRRGLGDRSYGGVALISSVIGGALGGRLLPPDHGHELFHHRLFIGVSAAIAMFLCAREIARLAANVENRVSS